MWLWLYQTMVWADLGIYFYLYDTNSYVRWDLCELWNGARFSTDILTLTPVNSTQWVFQAGHPKTIKDKKWASAPSLANGLNSNGNIMNLGQKAVRVRVHLPSLDNIVNKPSIIACIFKKLTFMSENNFENICSALKFTNTNPPSYQDKFYEVRQIIVD